MAQWIKHTLFLRDPELGSKPPMPGGSQASVDICTKKALKCAHTRTHTHHFKNKNKDFLNF